MRAFIIWTIRVSLAISGISMVYLLFIFGHTEVAPLSHVVGAAAIAIVVAIVGGTLQWVGLPPDPDAKPSRKRRH